MSDTVSFAGSTFFIEISTRSPSLRPLPGYKRLWAFFYFIMALAGNLLFIGFVVIPKAVAETITALTYTNWLMFNFFLLIITLILMFFKFILIFFKIGEDKIE